MIELKSTEAIEKLKLPANWKRVPSNRHASATTVARWEELVTGRSYAEVRSCSRGWRVVVHCATGRPVVIEEGSAEACANAVRWHVLETDRVIALGSVKRPRWRSIPKQTRSPRHTLTYYDQWVHKIVAVSLSDDGGYRVVGEEDLVFRYAGDALRWLQWRHDRPVRVAGDEVAS